MYNNISTVTQFDKYHAVTILTHTMYMYIIIHVHNIHVYNTHVHIHVHIHVHLCITFTILRIRDETNSVFPHIQSQQCLITWLITLITQTMDITQQTTAFTHLASLKLLEKISVSPAFLESLLYVLEFNGVFIVFVHAMWSHQYIVK